MGFDLKNVPFFPTKHVSLTASDTAVFQWPTMILVLNTGNVAVADEDGVVITYTGVPAFTVIPVTASKLMATNTTATGFIGLYSEN